MLLLTSRARERGSMKKIDITLFFNEITLLGLRLEILYPFVDHFLIIEADRTHQNQPKPLYFEENKEKFSKYQDKIVHKKIKFPEGLDSWGRENFQRYVASKFLKELDLEDDDLILSSDLDEIPNPALFREAATHPFCFLNQMYFLYFLNFFSSKCITGTACVKYGILKALEQRYEGRSLQILRDRKDYELILPDGGWHYGYMSGAKVISEKSRAIVEGNLSGPNTTEEYFESQIKVALETKRSPYSPRNLQKIDLDTKQGYYSYITAKSGSWVEEKQALTPFPSIDKEILKKFCIPE